ncbi:hypothetical protein V8E36_002616 [Tilletia maclaganii]
MPAQQRAGVRNVGVDQDTPAKQDLLARQGLLIPPEAGSHGPALQPAPEDAARIASGLEAQNSPTGVLVPPELLSQLLSLSDTPTPAPVPAPALVPTAMPLLSTVAANVASSARPTSTLKVKPFPTPHSTTHSTKATDDDGDGPVPFKIVYLTPLFVLIGLFLIFSVGGKLWGWAWRSKQREIRRRRKHHQSLHKDTEHQALDPDRSADGPHACLSDDEDHVAAPVKRRLRERRSEQNLVHDNGNTGLLHAFGARVLGTKGALIPPTTRDRAGNKYSIPVQSNSWWKVHMHRAMSKTNLDEEDEDNDDEHLDRKALGRRYDDEPMAQIGRQPLITMSRRATFLSGSSSILRTPPGKSEPSSPTKLSTYRPDSPTRSAKPGTSYFPYTQDDNDDNNDMQSIIVHSPSVSPTKEDEPARWHCRSAISSTTRGTSLTRSDTMTSTCSHQSQRDRGPSSPSRKPTQRRNAGRRQDSIIEIESIPEPPPARLPAELRIGVNASSTAAAAGAAILDEGRGTSSIPSSPTKRQLDKALFIASPTVEAYGLQPALDLVVVNGTPTAGTQQSSGTSTPFSTTASRTNSERSARSADTVYSDGQQSFVTSSSNRSNSPQRRAALARRSPNKFRLGTAGGQFPGPSDTQNGDEDDEAFRLTRAYTSPPLRSTAGRIRTRDGKDKDEDGFHAAAASAFALDENDPEATPKRARTADSPGRANVYGASGKKLRTPAEKTRERMLALQSAQTMIDAGLLSRASGSP